MPNGGPKQLVPNACGSQTRMVPNGGPGHPWSETTMAPNPGSPKQLVSGPKWCGPKHLYGSKRRSQTPSDQTMVPTTQGPKLWVPNTHGPKRWSQTKLMVPMVRRWSQTWSETMVPNGIIPNSGPKHPWSQTAGPMQLVPNTSGGGSQGPRSQTVAQTMVPNHGPKHAWSQIVGPKHPWSTIVPHTHNPKQWSQNHGPKHAVPNTPKELVRDTHSPKRPTPNGGSQTPRSQTMVPTMVRNTHDPGSQTPLTKQWVQDTHGPK